MLPGCPSRRASALHLGRLEVAAAAPDEEQQRCREPGFHERFEGQCIPVSDYVEHYTELDQRAPVAPQ